MEERFAKRKEPRRFDQNSRQIPETTHGHGGGVHLYERGSKTSQSRDPRKAWSFVRLSIDFPRQAGKRTVAAIGK